MKSLRFLFNRNFLPLLFIIFAGVLAARSLIFQTGYFGTHDDLQLMRQLQMEKCFLDGQIPCRWAADMNFGFGLPLFNFYSSLPYFFGQIFRFLGFSFIATTKLNFAFSLIVSGITMYFLAKEFFGRAGGILSACFYIWAPYHAVDVYVRGALNENWALIFFPLIFLFTYKLVRTENVYFKWLVALTLSWFGLLMSHNIMVMIFIPFLAIWILLQMVLYKTKRLPQLIIAGIWSLGLAAFFTIPSLSENVLTHIKKQLSGYFLYSAHFVTLKQLLISRFGGYEGSSWEIESDGMSFSIGHLHWILSLLIGFIVIPKLFIIKVCGLRNRTMFVELRRHPILVITGFVFVAGWAASFFTHSRSNSLYLLITQLQYIQFPWRFLSIVIFAFSFLVGVIPYVLVKLKNKRIPLIGFFLKIFASFSQGLIVFFWAVTLVIVNWNYFKPNSEKIISVDDKEMLSGDFWRNQQSVGLWDYLPVSAKNIPGEFRLGVADVIEGEADIYDSSYGSYWSSFKADVGKDSVIRINTTYFPGWKIFIKENSNSKEIEPFIPDEERWGRMWINLPMGEHLVYAQIFNTPVRTWSNIISFISWVCLVVVLLRKKINQRLFGRS